MSKDIEAAVKTVAKGAAYTFLGLIVSKALWYFYRLIMARFLGATEYGLFSLAFSVFMISMLFSKLGISKGVVHFVSTYIGYDEPSKIRGTILSSFELTLPLSFIVAGILFGLAPAISNLILHEPMTAPIIRIFAIAIPMQTFLKNITHILKAYKRMDYFSIVENIFQPLMLVIISVLLVYSGYDLIGIAAAYAMSVLLSGALGFYIVQTRVFPIFGGAAARQHKNLLCFSLPLLGAEIGGLIHLHSDNFMLGWFANTGAADIGVYNAALPTAMLVQVFGTMFSTILFPVISTSLANKDNKTAMDITSVSIRWTIAAALPATILILLFPGPILRIIFGPSYVEGQFVLSFIVIAVFIKAILMPFRDHLLAQNRTSLILINTIVVAITNVLLNYLLIPSYGILGAGIAISISFALGSFLALLEAIFLLNVRPSLQGIWAFVAASIISAIPIYALAKSLTTTIGIELLMIFSLLFGILYAASFLLIGSPRNEDMIILHAILSRLKAEFESLQSLKKTVQS